MLDDEARQTKGRKAEHVDIVLGGGVNARYNAWDDVHLVHEALPEVDWASVALGTRFLGKALKAPLMVVGMTGGYPDAERLNGALAEAAAAHGVAMGVGSQRAALKDASARRSYTVVRDHDVPFVAANLGAPQLVPQGDRKPLGIKEAKELVSMLEADALAVHLNYLQEIVQPEGDRRAEGVLAALKDLARDLGVPVIVKETGAGIKRGTVHRLESAGVAAIDVGGLSGTTFAAVELARARAENAERHVRLGETFRDWGIPTPVAVVEAAGGPPVIGTGGLRTGLDAARALALGASVAGFAGEAIRAAHAGRAGTFLDEVVDGLRTACFLTGSRDVRALQGTQLVLTGRVKEWAEALGHDADRFGVLRAGRAL